MMCKSTSSSGWEYFIVWEDLGSSLMYVIYLLLYFYICDLVVEWYNPWIIFVSKKHELVELVVHLLCDWMVVCSSLGEPKLNFIFC